MLLVIVVIVEQCMMTCLWHLMCWFTWW